MIGLLDLAAALLLLVAGLGKLRDPAAAAAMLHRAAPRVPQPLRQPIAVRIGGALEAAVAAAVIATGSRPALVLLAACYAVFAAVAIRLTIMDPGASCGCFGRTDSPAGPAHIVVTLLATAAAIAGAAAPPGPLGGRLDVGVVPGLIGVAQAVLLAYLGLLSITAFPALAAARRRISA